MADLVLIEKASFLPYRSVTFACRIRSADVSDTLGQALQNRYHWQEMKQLRNQMANTPIRHRPNRSPLNTPVRSAGAKTRANPAPADQAVVVAVPISGGPLLRL
jgi:hypothetical protein